jgi:hypothetical protein
VRRRHRARAGVTRAALNPVDTFVVRFSGPEMCPVDLPGSKFSILIEDDGETGYVYATNETASEIFDALQLYVRGRSGAPAEATSCSWSGIPRSRG